MLSLVRVESMFAMDHVVVSHPHGRVAVLLEPVEQVLSLHGVETTDSVLVLTVFASRHVQIP
jgi:protoporphyrinogen oxidase